MVPDTAIEVQGLTHRFGDRTALDQISLTVPAGEVFALLGPNGGGKTTLFRILTTLLTPSDGTASIFGCDVVRSPHEVRRLIGVVFQSPSLDRKLTVRENLLHHGHLYGLRGFDLAQRIDEVLEKVSVQDRARERVDKLSGGLMRRVELAKSLIPQPRLLLLDEPGTGLDPQARRQVRQHLEDLRRDQGVTSILTTHFMEEADTCDRVGILDQGKLVALDAPASLKESVGGDVITLTARDSVSLAQAVKTKLGIDAKVIGDTLRIEHERGYEFAAKLADAFPDEIVKIAVGRPSLEDVVINLTGHPLDGFSGELSGASD